MNTVTRSQWGARAPRSTTGLSPSLQKGLAFHWEGPRMGSFTHDKCAGKLRVIQNYHMDNHGWADIAYNWVVCPHGYVFEGRGWGKRSAANGTNSCNDVYTAVCYLGGEGDPFTAEAKRAMSWLTSEWGRIYGRRAGVVPHSNCVATMCPGNDIRKFILDGGPWANLPAPTPPTTGVSPMHDPPLQIAATWRDPEGRVLAQVTPSGDVYAWGVPYRGDPSGESWWGTRKAAQIGPRDDGVTDGYMITATSGERYRFPL